MRDAIAILLLAVGVALYVRGSMGLRSMSAGPIVTAPGQTALQKADYYHGLSVGGIAVALTGLVVGAWTYWRHVRDRDMHVG